MKGDPFVLALLAAFPGAEVTVKPPPPIAALPSAPSSDADDDHIGDVMPEDAALDGDTPADEGGFDQIDEDDIR